MANFTEKATLLLDDRSSKGIDKINKALRNMRKEAVATQKALRAIAFPRGSGSYDKKIRDTASALNAFARAANKVPKRVSINVQMKGASAGQIRSMANALGQYKSASKNINSLIGAKAMNFSNLDRLVDKLVRVARAANMAQSKLSSVRANIPGGNFGVGSSRGPRQPSLGQQIGLNIRPLEIFWRSAMFQLSHTIVNSIQQGFAQGAKGFDVAINKARQMRLDEPTRQALTEAAFDRSRRNPILRADQRMDFYAEVSSNFPNPLDVTRMDDKIDMAVSAAVQTGQSAEEAFSGIATIFRGLGAAGLLQDTKGNFDPKVLSYLDAYISAKVSEGAQINWQEAFQLLKYARTSSQTMTPRQFFFELVSAADIGASTAGVQLNMSTKSFAGETTKKALAAQEAAGLREPGRMVKSGAVGSRTSYSYEAGRLIDEDLFRTDTREWIRKYIMGPGGVLDKAGIDLAKATPTEVVKALDPFSGNRNADDYLSRVILQYQEYALKAGRFLDRPFTPEEFNNISQTSSWVKLQEATQKVTEAFGLLADKLEGPIIGVLNFITQTAQQAVDLLRGTSSDKVQGALGASALAGGAVAGGVGLVKMLSFFGLPAAVSANTAALNRNTAALLGQGVAGGVGGQAGAAAAGGLLARFMRMGGIGAAAYLSMSPSLPDAENRKIQQQLALMETRERSPEIQENSRKLTEAINKLSVLNAEIGFGKQHGYDPNGQYMMDRRLQAGELQSTIESLQAGLNTSALQIQSAFDGGATKITDSAEGMGQLLADRLLGTASSWGSAAAAALMGQLGSLNLNVNQGPAAAAPNTGTNTNLATGG